MIPILLILLAAATYFIGTMNGSVLITRLIFHSNLHCVGNGQPNFANFSKVYGGKWSAAVVGIDIAKTAVAVLLGALLMSIPGQGFPGVGKLFAGFCCVLGDIYPAQDQFRGGKGFTCFLSCMWLADWRIGIVSSAIFGIALAFTQYMSLSQISSCVISVLACWSFVDTAALKGFCGVLTLFMTLVIAWRLRGSIIRLLEHREPKFRWGKLPESRLRDEDF